MYIYAYPVQVLLGMFGAVALGYEAYASLGIVCTIPSPWPVDSSSRNPPSVTRGGRRRSSDLRLQHWFPTRRKQVLDPPRSVTHGYADRMSLPTVSVLSVGKTQ